MSNIQQTIHQWIKGLINNDIQHSLLDTNFLKEDGMNIKVYIEYEKLQFSSLSHIYDLDDNFKIKILDAQQLNDKILTTIYIINKLDKIVCKMTLTLIKIEENFYITGNNFDTQLVPKYRIDEKTNNITNLSIAIKTPLNLKNIISSNFELSSLEKGDNYDSDGFYHATFNVNDIEFNKSFPFRLALEKDEKNYIEKRNVFFDIMDINLKPFKVINNELIIINEFYPVHLSYEKNSTHYNLEYPRDIKLNLENITKIIITDSLDNDWVVR